VSDNISIGGETIATDEVTINSTSVQVQRVKQAFGPDDSYNEVSANVPLPVNAMLSTATLQNGTTQLTPKFARVALAADGNIVAAVTDKKIRVLAMTVNVDTANDDLDVEDGSGGTNLWKFVNIPLGVWPLPYNPHGWFETTAGNALYGDITLAGAGVNIAVVYVEV